MDQDQQMSRRKDAEARAAQAFAPDRAANEASTISRPAPSRFVAHFRLEL
jgi:hypothetical protein